jgi:hypothetical protein
LTHGRPRAIAANEQLTGFFATVLKLRRDLILAGNEVQELETRMKVTVGETAPQAVEQRAPGSHELPAGAGGIHSAVFVEILPFARFNADIRASREFQAFQKSRHFGLEHDTRAPIIHGSR